MDAGRNLAQRERSGARERRQATQAEPTEQGMAAMEHGRMLPAGTPLAIGRRNNPLLVIAGPQPSGPRSARPKDKLRCETR
jgi:hypothetical protein